MFVIHKADVKRSSGTSRDVLADMSLLVVKDTSSTAEVWKQVHQLHLSTGKPTEAFTVVLPLRLGPTGLHPFMCRTMEQLFGDLSRMAAGRGLISAGKSSAGPPAALPAAHQHNQHNQYNQHKPAVEPVVSERHSRVVNLVLLGMSGSGKSASGNTILGQKIFISRPSSNQVTIECQVQKAELGARQVRLIDTPDLFDEDIDPSTRASQVRICKDMCQGGATVFLLVMHVSRFTDGERGVLRKLQDAFGQSVHEQTIILFTREDDLRQGDVLTFEEFLCTCHPDLKKIVLLCGGRCVFFENSASRPGQVEQLMHLVDRML